MLKQNKMDKLRKVKIKYNLIIFVLVVFIFTLCRLSPTFMRYYYEVTGRAIGYAKENRGATFTVVFHENTGTGSMENQIIQCGVSTALNENTFTKTGYSFKEWNTSEDGTGTSYADEAQINIATETTIHLYAQWQQGIALLVETGVRYNTLQEAINAAGTSGQKNIRLLADIRETTKINKNQNIVFDLQRYTLSNDGNTGESVPLTNEGTCYISNGTITTSTTSAAINNNSTGKLYISGGTVTSTGTKQAIYNDKGTIEITGGYFSSVGKDRATIQNQAGATLIITGGTIISKTANGEKGAVQNSGTMTIGIQDGNVNKTSPLIQGVTYGIFASSNFTFNDGIVKGNTAAINDETKAQIGETGYEIIHLEEIIDGVTYKTAHLGTTCSITFNPNGGTVTETTRTAEIGISIGELPIPIRGGYRFDGWFTLAEGGDEISESTIATGNITYFAHWTKKHTITFDSNCETIENTTREVINGNTVGTLPVLERIGWRFDGWFTLEEDGDEISASTVPTGDTTYFAHWTKYKVAEINGTQFDTITDALASITTNTQTTITVIEDTAENITIASGRKIILDMQDHALTPETNAAVITNNGTLTILNGNVSSTLATGTINNNAGGTLKIRGGTFTGTQRAAVYNVKGTVEISGGYFSSSAEGKPSNSALERATIQNLQNGKVTITGGTIVSTVQQAISNEATLTIGTQDGSINAASPVIIGQTYGIVSNNTLNFFDGIVKGIDDPISGTITQKETNSQEVDGTEVISGQTYNTKHLELLP